MRNEANGRVTPFWRRIGLLLIFLLLFTAPLLAHPQPQQAPEVAPGVEQLAAFGGAPGAVVIQGERAYAGEGAGLAVYDLSAAPQIVRHNFLPLPGLVNHMQLVGQRLYVTVGRVALPAGSTGLYIIDIADPDQPVIQANMRYTSISALAVAEPFVYLIDEHIGMQIVDVSDPSQPRRRGIFPRSPSGYPLYGPMVVSGDRLLIDDNRADSDHGGLLWIDVSDPDNPQLERVEDLPVNGMAVVDGRLFLSSATFDAMWITVRDSATVGNPPGCSSYTYTERPQNVLLVGFTAVGNLVYITNHQDQVIILDFNQPCDAVLAAVIDLSPRGYLSGGHLAADGNRLMVNYYSRDILIETSVFDVSTPSSPQLLAERQAPTGSNLPVATSVSDVFYMQSNAGGLRIIEFKGSEPRISGRVFTDRLIDVYTISGSWGYFSGTRYADSGFPRRLWIAGLSDPYQPEIRGELMLPDAQTRIVHQTGSYVFLSSFGSAANSLHIVDASNPDAPFFLSLIESDSVITSVDTSGNLLFVAVVAFNGADADGRLKIYDISRIDRPVLLSEYPLRGALAGLRARGDRVYVGTQHFEQGMGQFDVVDIGNPLQPVRLGAYETTIRNFVGAFALSGDYAYLDGWYDTITLLDISDPTQLQLSGAIRLPAQNGMYIGADDRLYVGGQGGLRVLRVDPQCLPTPQVYLPLVVRQWENDVAGPFSPLSGRRNGLAIQEVVLDRR